MTEGAARIGKNPFRLDGKLALVTGAGRGIGRAVALALADAGAELLLNSRTPSELAEVAAEIVGNGRPGAPAAVRCDRQRGGARRDRRTAPPRHPGQQRRDQPAASLSRRRRADPRPHGRAQRQGAVRRRAGGGAAHGPRRRRGRHQRDLANGPCRLRARPHGLCDDQARDRGADKGDGRSSWRRKACASSRSRRPLSTRR